MLSYLLFFGWQLFFSFGQTLNLTIIHTAYLRGNYVPVDSFGYPCENRTSSSCSGGMWNRARIFEEIKNSTPFVVTVDCGSNIHGSVFSQTDQGKLMFHTFDEIGYDVVTLGARDFQFQETTPLGPMIANASFNTILSNTQLTSGSLSGASSRKVITLGGSRIGFIGLVPADTMNTSSWPVDSPIYDPTVACLEHVDWFIQQGIQIIFLLGNHFGTPEIQDIVKACPGIDVVITDGGSSTANLPTMKANNTKKQIHYPQFLQAPLATRTIPYVYPLRYGLSVGKLDLQIVNGNVVSASGDNIDASYNTVDSPLISLIRTSVLTAYPIDNGSLPIGETLVPWDSSVNRTSENTLGDIITDSMLVAAKKEEPATTMAFLNTGAIGKRTLVNKTITESVVRDVFPFANYLCIADLLGSSLVEVFTVSVALYQPPSFLQMSGVRIKWNPNENGQARIIPGYPVTVYDKVVSIEINIGGSYQPIDINRVYRVVTLDYICTGGDFYSMFLYPNTTIISLNYMLAYDAFEGFIKAETPVAYEIQGRIQESEDAPVNFFAEPPPPFNYIYIICIVIAVTLFFVLLMALITVFYLRRTRIDWSDLPKEVAASYRHYYDKPRKWSKEGSDLQKYYSRELRSGSKEYLRVQHLFDQELKGYEMKIAKITAVYNPTLVKNFIGAYRIMKARLLLSPGLFAKSTWRDTASIQSQNNEGKERVAAVLQQKLNSCRWNRRSTVPVMLTCHGTSEGTAQNIAETGFATLSSLDEGFFGKGIYFSSFVSYTIPYLKKPYPAIILTWLLPGHAFPVTEPHRGPGSLVGTALKGGYNSHYVITHADGTVATKTSNPDECYDEVVINQESQVAPAWIVTIDNDSYGQALRMWKSRVKGVLSPRSPESPKTVDQR